MTAYVDAYKNFFRRGYEFLATIERDLADFRLEAAKKGEGMRKGLTGQPKGALIFGVSLETILYRENDHVPKFLEEILTVIEQKCTFSFFFPENSLKFLNTHRSGDRRHLSYQSTKVTC